MRKQLLVLRKNERLQFSGIEKIQIRQCCVYRSHTRSIQLCTGSCTSAHKYLWKPSRCPVRTAEPLKRLIAKLRRLEFGRKSEKL